MNINYKLIVLATSLVFALSASISAAPGDLDVTFSGDGKLTDWLSRGDDYASSIAIQPDGKIVVAGSTRGDFAVARYNTDGSLDTTFGTGGKVTTDINSSYDWANAIAIQQDGKIVVAGTSGGGPQPDFALVRYNSDGSLDTSFGSNGKVTTDIDSGAEEAYSVAIYTDGKIVAGGRRSTYDSGGTNDFAVVRYNSDGSLDTTFDSDGKVTTDIPSPYDVAYSVAIQTDGKLVAAGRSYNPSTSRFDFTLVRYNAGGSLDTSFDGDGKVTTHVGSASSEAHSVAIQPDGKIVAAGYASGFGLVRYSSNGSPENITTIQISSPTGGVADSVALQPDGKIVAAGYGGSNNSFAVVRLNANFSIDTTFGTNGKVTTAIGWAHQVAVEPDGKIVATGSGPHDGNSSDFFVVRYNANGSPDTSFDGDGQITTDFGFFQANALHDTAIQTDGRIVAVGEVRGDFAVLRYNPDGSADATFGSGTGKARTGMRSYDGAHAVAIQTDGKIVATGGSLDGDGNGCGFALARYNSEGSLDATFGVGGRVDTGCYFGPVFSSSGALDVAIQPDGKIVAAGEGYWSDSHEGFLLIRFNPNGSLDTSFDGDGIAITPIGSYAVATSVAIQSDGKIVAAGGSHVGSYDGVSSFTLARYNPDGSLDTTFDGDGMVTTPIGTSSNATSLAIQSDGKIVASGFSTVGSNNDIAVVRYNPNGSLDATFDSDGILTTAIGSGEYTASSVAIEGSGKLVVAGTSRGDFALLRYLPNGSLDTTFGGGDGISTVDFGTSYDQINGMALDSQGRAVVVGASDGRFAIARFLLGDRTPTCTNPIDCPDFFIRQQYRDFLGREAEAEGLQFYLNILNGCYPNDAECIRYTHGALSANFFRSPEFQTKGSYVMYLYMVTIGQRAVTAAELQDASKVERPHYAEFTTDMSAISSPDDRNGPDPAKKVALTQEFVQRAEVVAKYPASTYPTLVSFGNALATTAGVTLSSATQSAIAAAATRAQVLQIIAESAEVNAKFYQPTFVTMEYFGYLRRDPEDCHDPANYFGTGDPNACGFIYQNRRFNELLPQLGSDLTQNFMVRGFIESPEYRGRFGLP